MKKHIDNNGIWKDVFKYFESNNQKLVIKPNNGSEGQGVFLCKNFKETEKAIITLFKNKRSISLCPYYNIKKDIII